MSASKPLVIRSLCILALAGLIVAAMQQHGAVAQARAAHQALLKDRDEADRLTRENSQLEQLRGMNKEVSELRQNERELLRLRNQVGQWRAQAAEAARLRAENQRLASWSSTGSAPKGADAMPADFLDRTALADAGLGSPEATVQTFFYAMTHGDVSRVYQCTATKFELTLEQEQNWGDGYRKDFADLPGYSIAQKNIISPDEVQISVQASPGGEIFPVHLIRHGNEWNVQP